MKDVNSKKITSSQKFDTTMPNNLNIEEIVSNIFDKLNEDRCFRTDNFIRATDDDKLLNKLKAKTKDGDLTHSINRYLSSYNDNERMFYNYIEEKVLPKVNLNPHNSPNPYDEYFVDNIEGVQLAHIQKLYALLEKDRTTEVLELIKKQNILQIGSKGSGKTISQNVWLQNKNDALEQNKIVWIRLDARKLIDIWEQGNAFLDEEDNENVPFLITPEMYILGQLVYVFSKHFQKKFPEYSNLFGGISLELCSSDDNNLSKHSLDYKVELTKARAKSYGIDIPTVSLLAEKKGFKTIIDYLVHFETIIAKGEGTYGGTEKRKARKEKKDTSYSFLIDKVLLDSQKLQRPTDLFKEWIVVAKILQEFILRKKYYILYIIDGIDNINFYHTKRKKYLKTILNLLYVFPLKKSNSNISKNELLLLSLRNRTFNELMKIQKEIHYNDINLYKTVDNFYPISQQTKKLLKPVINKRIGIMLADDDIHIKAIKNNCFMASVIKDIQEFHYIPNEERWHFNIRCFLYNHITLARFITFKYYFAGEPNDFDIRKKITTYEDINFLLNGYLFLWEKMQKPISNEGHDCFNLFGYTKDEKPLYFIYTYILLLLRNCGSILMQKITDILCCFGEINTIDCDNCIDKLVSSGMITQEYSQNVEDYEYKITEKGNFALQKFYNDIHFLYYTSLDTKVPEKLLNSFFIAPNNYDTDSDRNYPPYCIITGICFLRYLLFQNGKIVRNTKLKNKLKLLGIDINIFDITKLINDEDISNSVETMVKTTSRNESHTQILINWLLNPNS